MAKSRTKNTIYNFISSIGGQFLTILLQFVVRTVFIATLGKSYLGISGLFTNILSMLSLAELGVGTAIVYKLYDPIAREDHHRIAVLMRFYKMVYRWIGIAIAVIGLALIPFLPKLIKDYDKLATLQLNAVLIFILYLLESVSSYFFFAYKTAIINANQKAYLVNIFTYVFMVVFRILQIISLLLFKNFILYVALQVVQVIGQNFACARLADKMYPFINENSGERLSSEESRGIFKDCTALMMYRINGVVVKSTDNIILSAFLGLDTVALYSNYYIFYTTIGTLFKRVFQSVSHSLGNLHTTHDPEHEYEIFQIVFFIAAILGGTAFAGISAVSDELVNQWIGQEWVLAKPFAVLMGLEVFTMPFKSALNNYRSTMGLFQQAKYRPVFGMVINLVVSILLVNIWGINGVLVGTIASDWLTFMWYDPLVVHRVGFENHFSVWKYYMRFGEYVLISSVVTALDCFVCSHFFTGHGWISVLIHIAICGVSVPLVMTAFFFRKPEGQYVMKYIRRIIRKGKKIKG